jgi:ADP-ribosyl-[dinitrogen reductase] hydrolase
VKLDPKQTDRAVGVLLASAAGDALGVPYEFGSRALIGEPEQLGGGLGPFEPGEWSDDTSMACAIAEVAATGADLRTTDALDAVANGFLRWYDSNPGDIGIQTHKVLSGTTGGPGAAARMTAVAAALTGKTAGNGSLMRTGPVALAHLGDTAAIVQAARAISALTHADPTAGDACVLWCLAIDHAVRTGDLDVRVGLPHVDKEWVPLIAAAEAAEPASFVGNGWVVSALQAAVSAITHTPTLRDALIAAVRAGNDTDTVAAITGALAGAKYGGSAVPFAWRRRLHGWPDYRAHDLMRLAVLAAKGGKSDDEGWPASDTMPYRGASATKLAHPDDEGLLLGGVGALLPGVADAVVSLCRLGHTQVPLEGIAPEDHIEIWLIDIKDANNDPATVLRDAAEAVQSLRNEGKTVFLHCVNAETRTPLVAAAYGALHTGTSTAEAVDRIRNVLPTTGQRTKDLWVALESMSFGDPA